MRRLSISVAFCLAVACGGADAAGSPPIDPRAAAPVTTSTTPAAPTTTAPEVTTTTEPPLRAETLPDGEALVLAARGPVEVFSSPEEGEPIRVLEPETILGTTTVVTVLAGPDDGWARVMLPGRPNGSEGWVRSEEMDDFVIEGNLVVDLSDRLLTYYSGDDEVLTTTVAIGSGRNPTPTGVFYVTDNVSLADPDGPWGPHALGLSARSGTITDFNGGDGIIGIHGTNRPGSIGEAASLGCVRAPNDVMSLLHDQVALGTPVEIRA